jgi:restriction system protein
MAEITPRRAGELLRPLFGILLENSEGIEAREALSELEKRVTLTPFEAADYPNRPGVRRFEKLVRFHSINAVKAGWMTKQKGRWYITYEGRAAYETYQDPEAFMREAIRLYRKWAKEQPELPAVPAEPPHDEPDAASTLEDAEEEAQSAIEAHLQSMNPYDFQDLVAALLKAMGYYVSWVAPTGADDGIDIVAFSDPLGANGPRIKVQVKRHGSKADVDALRSFMAVLADDDVGIYVNTGGFTGPAQREARLQPSRRLTLLDLARVVELWIEHYDRMDEADRGRLPLKSVHYLAPAEGS